MHDSIAWSQVTVFAGPSLSPREVEGAIPGVVVRPPAKRGDLHHARETGARVILLIDGVFAHHLAVSPREVVEVARQGTCVIGASSMGALRAVDCRPVGVIGIGLVYRLFRKGVLESDDEVAVATNPDDAFAAMSVALVNVRCAVARAVRQRIIDPASARAIIAAAKALYFPERNWPAILDGARIIDDRDRILGYCRPIDVKKEDARRVLAWLPRFVRDPRRDPPGAPAVSVQRSHSPQPARRYAGHDRLFGEPIDQVRRELCEWLCATGRYQRYIWPLIAGAPEFDASRDVVREQLGAVVQRFLGDTDRAARELWGELEFTGQLDRELASWHAHHALAAGARRSGVRLPQHTLLRTCRELASRHQPDGVLAAIPPAWIGAAAERIALARAFSARGVR